MLRLLFATALTVETTGLLLTFSVSKAIQQGLTSIIRAAKAFSTGQLGARAKVLSRDEIGVVAKSFNEMADNLQKQVRELADLNRSQGTRDCGARTRPDGTAGGFRVAGPACQ